MVRVTRRSYTALDGQHIRPVLSIQDDGRDDRGSEVTPAKDRSYLFDGILASTNPRERSRNSVLSYLSPRRRLTRLFTFVLTVSLIVFTLFLARHSWSPSRLFKEEAPLVPWDSFPFLKRYYGGINTLVTMRENRPEYPIEDTTLSERHQNAQAVKRQSRIPLEAHNPYDLKSGVLNAQKCYLDAAEKISIPSIVMHQGIPSGFPDPVMGSYDLLRLNRRGCFDRYGRLGPYGLGYSRYKGGSGANLYGQGHDEIMKYIWKDSSPIDYEHIKWASAQARCLHKNRKRYTNIADPTYSKGMTLFGSTSIDREMREVPVSQPSKREAQSSGNVGVGLQPMTRTAIVVRTWLGYEYDAEDLMYLRALINEVAIASGGEYDVHFLIHVKNEDDSQMPWLDEASYQRILDKALPAEFRGMGTLWSETLMRLVYAGLQETNYLGLPVYGAFRGLYLPMQYFAHVHPEYEFFWHWEMDSRYTGNYYDLFDKIGTWAREQPRKGLWERNERFYVPSEHGSWPEFTKMAREQTDLGESGDVNAKDSSRPEATDAPEPPIWGPHPVTGPNVKAYTADDSKPPTSHAQDNYKWGAGEDADFITLNPLFDPNGTEWILTNDMTGYNLTDATVPRRTAIITASRLSRKLLELMHNEVTQMRQTMSTEMWPGSVALHHGLKAVYAPHPVYIDRFWPTSYLASIFNNGRHGSSGGAVTSVFSDNRQHNFLGTTWYYHAGFSANLWKRWLGLVVNNDGGVQTEDNGEGRMCLPPMMLHPVKQVDLDFGLRDTGDQ